MRTGTLCLQKRLSCLTNAGGAEGKSEGNCLMLIEMIEKRIPNHENVRDERVRSAYGKAASFVGIGCNVLLFAGKLLVGTISG